MPTDISVSIKERHIAKRKDASDLRAYVFLIPVAACLLSIFFAMESRAFEAEIVQLGLME